MATKKMFTSLDFQQVGELKNAKFEILAADPGSPVQGQIWFNSTDNRYKFFDGANVCEIACMEDVNRIGQFIGSHDASTGIPASTGPGGDINAGDFWRVTVAGTIAGIVGASDVLEPGDVIFALVDNPAAAGDFLAVQTNVDLANSMIGEDVVVASLPANTPTVVSPTLFSGAIHSYVILDSTGEEISVCVSRQPNQLTIESNIALTNVVVSMVGKP